ncbi:MAG: PorV/PorQ family protein [Elusimicrobiota bacterium]
MKRILLSMALLFCGARLSPAGAAGGEVFDFLFLDANARASALGGAYTAQAVDANALQYNPAGLSKADGHELTFMHNSHAQGVFQDYIGYAAPRGWGLHLNYLSFGDVQRTTLDNPTGTGLGRTGMSDIMAGAGYGWAYSDDFNFGAGVKFVRESIDRISAEGYALDLGVLYNSQSYPDFRLGTAVQNIGPTVQFLDKRESLPLNVRLGAAYDILYRDKEHTVSLDLSKERSDALLVAFGVETRLAPAMPLRLGFTTRSDTGPRVTAGIGWIHKNFAFDYAFAPYGDLGLTHRFSVTARWEGGIPLRRLPKRGSQRLERPAKLAASDDFDVVDEFMEMGMLEAAQEELEALEPHIRSDDIKRVRYRERLGTIALRRNRLYQAKTYYQEGIKIAIQLSLGGAAVADAYAGIGRCLVKEGEFDRALQFFLKALQAGPSAASRADINRSVRQLKRRRTHQKD